MTIVTLCGNQTNDADCGYCLQSKDCRDKRDQICWGCKREFLCPLMFKQKRADAGMCRGREMIAVDEFTRLHGKGI
jgi:hypothetical protein